jgi:tRNA(Ile)-lysidine synthase
LHDSSPLVTKIRPFWSSLEPGHVIVAVSGGPDSVALLLALVAMDVGPLVMAHLNHQLRGPDSNADEDFVRELHATLSQAGKVTPDFYCERIDVAGRARAEQDNLENTARRIRYAWLTTLAQDHKARYVATGHTADDQAETVLHRLMRGTGLKGLAGIPARRKLAPGVEVVRPLLRVARAEVLAFLREQRQPYREDSSNLDARFTRNRIRHELLPSLAEHFNPAIVSVLCRLGEQAQEVYHDVEARARELFRQSELPRSALALVFDRHCLAAAPRHLIREVFHLAWEREQWPMSALTFEDWDRMAAVALGEVSAVDLPGGFRIQARDRVVQLGK